MSIEEYRSVCSGCRACEQVCPQKCISMNKDIEGFLYPKIADEKCIRCKKCEVTCNTIGKYKNRKENIKVYAAKNKDLDCRIKSSSGGVFFSIAEWILEQKGVVFGAAFSDDYLVKHIAIKTIDDIYKLMGSKYLQSDTNNTFLSVKKELLDEKWVLYSGTPCQIEGLNAYLGKEYKKLICIVVICHGVPSSEIWSRYMCLKKGQYAAQNITDINFRNKKNGWNHYEVEIKFKDISYENSYRNDYYMQGFLQNLYLRPSCYSCKSKGLINSADFIIGDYWGIERVIPDFSDDYGISAIIINSKKAYSLWDKIKKAFLLRETTYNDVLKYNAALEESAKQNVRRTKFFLELNETQNLEESIKNNLIETVIHENSRRKYQYPIIYKYLEQTLSHKGICSVLSRHQKENIILYAITDITDLVIKEIQNNNEISLCAICDKNHSAYNGFYRNVKVVSIDEMQLMMEEKEFLIIICNPMRENQIFDDLLNRGFSLEDIVSVTSLIFD